MCVYVYMYMYVYVWLCGVWCVGAMQQPTSNMPKEG